MNTIIEKSFQNSRFYRNYNNIECAFLKFEKIKKEYIKSKNKYDNNVYSFILKFDKIKTLEKIVINTSSKIEKIVFQYDEPNVITPEQSIIIRNKYNSCRKILYEKINICKNIKKYINYYGNINDVFIKTVESCYIKNINKSIKYGADIHIYNDRAFKISIINGNIEIVKFLIGKGFDIHMCDDYALIWSSFYGHTELVKFLISSDLNYFSKNQ